MKSLVNKTFSLGLIIVAGTSFALADARLAGEQAGEAAGFIEQAADYEAGLSKPVALISPIGIECKKPKSKLYKAVDSNDAVELEMIAPFEKLGRKGEPAIRAVIRYREGNKAMVLPVLLSGRGNSRGSYCAFKPFRIAFTTNELAQEIEQALLQRGVRPESKDYLAQYQKEFLATQYDEKTEGKPPKNGLFDDLGDDVKVVTHCGQNNYGAGDWPGGRTELDQDNRLLMEHYLYEIINQTKLPVEATRLAHIKYYDTQGAPLFKDNNGQVKAKLAFFREPPTSLAKRCDLLSKPPQGVLAPPVVNGRGVEYDEDSNAALSIVNKFVGNSDFGVGWAGDKQGHNVNYLFDKQGRKYLGAYDFDLAHAVTMERSGTIESVVQGLKNALSGLNGGIDNSKTAATIASRFYGAKEGMEGVLAKAKLAPVYKQRADKWLASQMEVFRATIEQNKAR